MWNVAISTSNNKTAVSLRPKLYNTTQSNEIRRELSQNHKTHANQQNK